VNLQQELAALLASGLRFSIEITHGAVAIWTGDYLRAHAPAVVVPTTEDAIQWLKDRRSLIALTT
jgi:hypothetical protein